MYFTTSTNSGCSTSGICMLLCINMNESQTRKRPTTAPGEIYHIYNRGVEKRSVFENSDDYYRFIRCLFELNDANPVGKLYIKKIPDVPLPEFKKRDMLIDILVFCLMPNHYHLIVQERVENGTTAFMRKLGTGYTNYFNQKYQRVGPLFQGIFKLIHVERDEQLQYLPFYIHLNPLDLILPNWREGILDDTKKALKFLHDYRWSSYRDYINIKNFPSITRRDFLTTIIGDGNEQQKQMIDWVCRNGPEEIEHILLE